MVRRIKQKLATTNYITNERRNYLFSQKRSITLVYFFLLFNPLLENQTRHIV